MKILSQENVVRYHVEFDEEETALHKAYGLLPPYAEPCARLWLTAIELEESKALLAKAKAGQS